MWIANRNMFDVAGFLFQVFLWGSFWLLAADGERILRKEDVRRLYDGSIFFMRLRRGGGRGRDCLGGEEELCSDMFS